MYDKHANNETGVDEEAKVADNAKIGENVYIGSFAYISDGATIGNNVKIFPQVFIGKGVEVKENTTIYPGAKIYSNVQIGANCIIHAGAVVGSDGFGFAPTGGDNYKKIVHVGNVILEDWVEIGANTTIDKATMGSTIIRKGVKLDNLTHIAHNVEVGERTVMAAQTGVAGSTKIGSDCMFGGQVGIGPHIKIANAVKLGAQSGIGAHIKKEGDILQGTPAMNIRNFQKSAIIHKNLPDIRKQLISAENEIKELKEIVKQLVDSKK